MGLFKGERTPFDMTKFIVVAGIAIVLVNIFASILGIWFEDFVKVSQQISLGLLFMVVMAAVLLPYIILKRHTIGAGGLTTKDLIAVTLVIALVVFLLVVVPGLFNLPETFSVAHLQLQSIFIS